jgi:Zn-dependent peptidase ImmA (M78 family)/plasmid maintenance system antidote protein VapI
MEKIAINPNRLEWCCKTLGISVAEFFNDIDIAESTLEQVINKKSILSIKQLEKIADYFNKSLTFFLEKTDVVEEKIYSLQFRTINNQKPIHSKKLRKFIDNVEIHRKIYLGLLEDSNITISKDWKNIQNTTNNIKHFSKNVREWLGLQENYKFNDLRNSIESKGIMVIVSNGYGGAWQIDKKDQTRGFCLNYDTFPVIAIKKQTDGAKAFTLMHELAHLLLHKESAIDDSDDFYSYKGKEKEANEFASNILIPDNYLAEIDVSDLEIEEHGNYLQTFKDKLCVSGDAILYRLFIEHKITKAHYQSYRNYKLTLIKEREHKENIAKEQGKPKTIPRKYRHREPINIFGKKYVTTVLNAHQNKKITLFKASSYLDNLKIHTLHKLEKEFV